MKKVMFLLLVTLSAIYRPCRATDYYSDELLSLIKLSPETATQDKVTTLLGKPGKVEENKKGTLWFYDHGNSSLVISWDKKLLLKKCSFNNKLTEKSVYDTRTSNKLQSGVTNITEALKILGMPQDMTIKELTQEMHYAYQNNVLRLFFRNKMLVDYTLY